MWNLPFPLLSWMTNIPYNGIHPFLIQWIQSTSYWITKVAFPHRSKSLTPPKTAYKHLCKWGLLIRDLIKLWKLSSNSTQEFYLPFIHMCKYSDTCRCHEHWNGSTMSYLKNNHSVPNHEYNKICRKLYLFILNEWYSYLKFGIFNRINSQ